MRKVILWSLLIVTTGLNAGNAFSAEPFTVGEKWTYKHEGIVPMRPPDYTLTGDRTCEVISVRGEGENKRWLILEKWGEDDEWAGKRTVCAERMYDRIESGEDRISTVKPAYPYDYMNLKSGEEKKYESTFSFGDQFTFPIQVTTKRLKDETIKVPAGNYENCIHVESNETVTFTGQDGNEMKISTKRELWYHPKVNGLVKEIHERSNPDGGTGKGTSELKSYTKNKEG